MIFLIGVFIGTVLNLLCMIITKEHDIDPTNIPIVGIFLKVACHVATDIYIIFAILVDICHEI